jgi:hypothetical protein
MTRHLDLEALYLPAGQCYSEMAEKGSVQNHRMGVSMMADFDYVSADFHTSGGRRIYSPIAS